MNASPRAANPTDAPDPDLLHVAALFFPEADQVEPVPGRDEIVRAQTVTGWWKVRRWPEAIPRSRVEFIHRVLAAVAAETSLAPRVAARADGETTAVYQGRLYDAQSWLPGSPAGGGPEARLESGRWVALPAAIADPVFADVVRSVARIHGVTAELAATVELSARDPLRELVGAVTEAWKAQRGVLRPIATRTPAVRRWLATGERALPAAEAAIGAAGGPVAPAINHFGLWPAHALLSEAAPERTVTGFVGWELCNAGSPLIDLAQVVSRFRGWTAVGAEMAIAAYSEVQPLRPEDRRLLPAVAALDLIATCGQMLISAYGGRPGGARPPTSLREAARTLLDSLDVATNALAALDRPKRGSGDRDRRPPARRRTEPKRKPRGPKKRR